MAALLTDINEHACKLAVHQQRHLSVMLKSMASDSPVLSYLPHTAAELILTGLQQSTFAAFASDLLAVLKFKAPHFLDFCTALDAMRSVKALGMALQYDCGAFASSVASISIRCGQGGPVIPLQIDMESRPSSTSNACLQSGVCVGVAKVRARPAYAFEKDSCHSDDSTSCRHSFVSGSHGSRRTGGIFCWYCRHEICYGHYIMPNAEGRTEAFSFLYKYFAVAPKVVVYDFFLCPARLLSQQAARSFQEHLVSCGQVPLVWTHSML